MATKAFLGEFEQMVLLSILRLGDEAFGPAAREELLQIAGRKVSRGAFYTTLDRLRTKGYLEWELEKTGPGRGGMPKRLFHVTETGIAALRESRNVLGALWSGLEGVLS